MESVLCQKKSEANFISLFASASWPAQTNKKKEPTIDSTAAAAAAVAAVDDHFADH